MMCIQQNTQVSSEMTNDQLLSKVFKDQIGSKRTKKVSSKSSSAIKRRQEKKRLSVLRNKQRRVKELQQKNYVSDDDSDDEEDDEEEEDFEGLPEWSLIYRDSQHKIVAVYQDSHSVCNLIEDFKKDLVDINMSNSHLKRRYEYVCSRLKSAIEFHSNYASDLKSGNLLDIFGGTLNYVENHVKYFKEFLEFIDEKFT